MKSEVSSLEKIFGMTLSLALRGKIKKKTTKQYDDGYVVLGNHFNPNLIPSFRTLREKCLYSKFFWSAFSRIRTEYGDILRISPYSVQMQENTDQKNSKYGYFSRRGKIALE